MNILIAEDKSEIANLVRIFLEKEGFQVVITKDGQEALDYLLANHVDLCIFDIMMPRLDGLSLIQQVRKFTSIPILILTAKNLEEDKILGLDLGADDYITKPFSSLELVSRVKAHLRRNYGMNDKTVQQYGNLTVDTQRCTVMKSGQDVCLTATEYKILLKFLSSPERVFTKSQLYDAALGDFIDGDENTIVVHISNLRDKIEDNPREPRYIKTIRGLG
ncbi:MAG: response regulator transcription factor, partial [Oscillospiraceae bacterium]